MTYGGGGRQVPTRLRWPKGEEEAPWEARAVIQLLIRWYSELMSAISASRRRGNALWLRTMHSSTAHGYQASACMQSSSKKK
jgi:hypothetical protein